MTGKTELAVLLTSGLQKKKRKKKRKYCRENGFICTAFEKCISLHRVS